MSKNTKMIPVTDLKRGALVNLRSLYPAKVPAGFLAVIRRRLDRARGLVWVSVRTPDGEIAYGVPTDAVLEVLANAGEVTDRNGNPIIVTVPEDDVVRKRGVCPVCADGECETKSNLCGK